MKFAEVTGWVEQHPTESIVIGAGGLIAILWLLGYFSSSSSTSNSGASSLASAYYAAEAQQAVVGGQIQVATIQAAAQTAQTADQANAAVAIQKSQSKAATTINGQNASAATTIQDTGNNDQLLATYSNNAAATAIAQSNNAAAATIAASNNQTSWMNNIISNILPTELVQGGGIAHVTGPGGVDLGFGAGTGAYTTPNTLAAGGFSPSQIAAWANSATGA